MISNDKIFEYEKILGLRADRRGQDRRKKQSLEARADAFLRLKKGTRKVQFSEKGKKNVRKGRKR